MGPFAEFERVLIRERQRGGTALAKQLADRGQQRFMSRNWTYQLIRRAAARKTKTAQGRELNISPEAGYQYLRTVTVTVTDSVLTT